MHDPIGISGIGLLTSSGTGIREVWESVMDQKVIKGVRNYKTKEGIHLKYPVYPINIDKVIHRWLEPKTIKWLKNENLIEDNDFILMLIASKMALLDADLPSKESHTISLVIAHENLGVNRLIDKVIAANHGKDKIPSFSDDSMSSFTSFQEDFFKLQSFPHLFNLSKALKLEGLTYVVNNACASGLYALELANMMIKSRQADVVLVVSSDYAHVTEHLWLQNKGFVSNSNNLRPFDIKSDGAILGDGAAAMVLESAEFVSKYNRKNRNKCLFKGSSLQQDNWRMTVPDVTKNTYSSVIKNILLRGGIMEIDLIIPHGAGIPMWDHYESKEINKAFSKHNIPPVTALKGYFGHTLGANAIIESTILIECLKNNVIPPTYNFSQTTSEINLPIVNKITEKRLNTVMKSVAAYGGFHAASIFEKVE
ncbi:beta-ketoacyl synthase N-terminal-like domain-containing protein [Bacillus toyonensis]|uniref:beta-ketoacyl synthase N-terminal-like domain-containing protein n=1 Tax=Bacillus toyonensis TaxID=155322 RepID=UPI000BF0ED4B|nr:beta-ketoacyl synthase N-terminal-like domain-containing protein [Bacillus toyonensis]PEM43195.1 beta-ketoacyl synthase [Bacillus toyonensis]